MNFFQKEIDFASMRALVIDDAPTSRTAMKTQLHQAGVADVATASSVNEARRALGCAEGTRGITPYYDIILCDYYMGEGLNGQDVLEELRCTGKLKNAQVFFMITAEAAYQTVAEVAEYCPDDYLLKPITGARLSERLEAAIIKKRAMKDIYKAFESKKWAETVSVASKLINDGALSKTHALEARKFMAQAMIEMGQIDSAKAIFSNVADNFGIPWAKLGLAQIKIIEGDLDGAILDLEQLISENPKYMSAVDTNINLHEKRMDLEKAFDMSVQALNSTPNNVSRLQKAGSIASTMGNNQDAEKYLSKVLKIGLLSPFLAPRTFLQLAVAKMSLGEKKEVSGIINDLNNYLENNPKTSSKLIIKRLGSIVLSLSKQEVDKAIEGINEMAPLVMSDEFTWECCQDFMKLAKIAFGQKYGNTISDSNIGGVTTEHPAFIIIGEMMNNIIRRFSGTKQLFDCIEGAVKENEFLASMARASNEVFEKIIQKQMINIARKNFKEAAESFERLSKETKNEWLLFAATRARAKMDNRDALVA